MRPVVYAVAFTVAAFFLLWLFGLAEVRFN
jgi:hypothetical protein